MDLFETVESRRSVRNFSPNPIPREAVRRALEMATLAPNSSNLQTWDFYWVRSGELKSKMVYCCFSQSAARSASDFVVVAANPRNWRRSLPEIVPFLERTKAPKSTLAYYKKSIPFVHNENFFFKIARWLVVNVVGFIRPIPRNTMRKSEAEEVAIKSAALAAQNFALAITAQGYGTCMMEGFDEWRVKKALKMPRGTRICMVIACGEPLSDAYEWPRFRLDNDVVIHEL